MQNSSVFAYRSVKKTNFLVILRFIVRYPMNRPKPWRAKLHTYVTVATCIFECFCMVIKWAWTGHANAATVQIGLRRTEEAPNRTSWKRKKPPLIGRLSG